MADAGHIAAAQTAFMGLKTGAFLHFDITTFTGTGSVGQNVNSFQPTALNVGQWLDAVKAAGMGYAVLTAYHACSFCLWNTSVAQWEGGAIRKCTSVTLTATGQACPDIVNLFVLGCRSRGIMPCVYHGINHQTAGYDANVAAHLTELITAYPDIGMFWIDNGGVDLPAGWFATFKSAVEAVAPSCLVLVNSSARATPLALTATDVRGNESGINRSNAYCYANTDPVEISNTIYKSAAWFYSGAAVLRTKEDLLAEKLACDQARALSTGATAGFNFLLNCPPDTTGTIPSATAALMLETFSPRVDRCAGATSAISATSYYNTNSTTTGADARTYGPQKVTNGKYLSTTQGMAQTAAADHTPVIKMDLGAASVIDTILAWDLKPAPSIHSTDLTFAVLDAAGSLVWRSSVINPNGAVSLTGLINTGVTPPAGTAGRYVQIERNQANTAGPWGSDSTTPYLYLSGFLVLQKVSAAIVVTSSIPSSMLAGATASNAASAKDLAGAAIQNQPTLTWSLTSGPGSINSSTGVYTAATTGTVVVRATDASTGKYGEATVNLIVPVSTTTVISAPDSPTFSGNITFTATVTGSTPTGTIQFQVNGDATGISAATMTSGMASKAITLAAGTYTITAIYSGDTNNLASTSAGVTQVAIDSANIVTTAGGSYPTTAASKADQLAADRAALPADAIRSIASGGPALVLGITNPGTLDVSAGTPATGARTHPWL